MKPMTGLTSQDGSCLLTLRSKEGHEVHGVLRLTTAPTTERIDHLPEIARCSNDHVVVEGRP